MNNKVYFAASIRGGRVDAALYKRIIDYIKKTDIVLTEHIGKSNMSLKAQTRAIPIFTSVILHGSNLATY